MAPKPVTSDETTVVSMRIPVWLHERLQHEAMSNNRSLNGELLQVLKSHLSSRCAKPHIPNAATLRAIREAQAPDAQQTALRIESLSDLLSD